MSGDVKYHLGTTHDKLYGDHTIRLVRGRRETLLTDIDLIRASWQTRRISKQSTQLSTVNSDASKTRIKTRRESGERGCAHDCSLPFHLL